MLNNEYFCILYSTIPELSNNLKPAGAAFVRYLHLNHAYPFLPSIHKVKPKLHYIYQVLNYLIWFDFTDSKELNFNAWNRVYYGIYIHT